MAHHVGMDFAPFRFFFAEKSVITLRHSSFIAKRHVRFACSFASALTTALGHYHLSARMRLTAQGFLLKQVSLVPIFLFQKISHNASSFLLYRKKARSVRLFVCKRTHDGSRSLPPFCEDAPYGAGVFSG